MIFFMRLGAEQGRIIGSLIEKQLTTPQQYPLSLNALIQACNQLSNRDPVVSYDERLVDETLVSLKEAGLVRFVHPSHGRSVTRYRQVLDERLALDDQQLALVAVLLLRGPQTVGELRTRTERMATFEGITSLDTELARLSGGLEPLVARLARRPGQKEERWAQLLMEEATTGRTEEAGLRGMAGGTGVGANRVTSRAGFVPPALGSSVPPPPSHALRSPADAPGIPLDQPSVAAEAALLEAELVAVREEVADLRGEVADLRGEVIDLRAALEHLEAQLGGI
jgi:uncharacterized protein YceH (UPF0502 family)